MSMSNPAEIARALIAAYGTRIPIAPVRGAVAGVAAAYAVQQEAVKIWRGQGRKAAGHKIGLTSKAVQAQLGVAEPDLAGLAAASMAMQLDGAEAATGRGEACLGNPAIAVAWLAEALTRFGGGLRAGDLVMSGALAKMITAEPGHSFTADFGELG